MLKRLALLTQLVAVGLTLTMVRVLHPNTREADILFSVWLLLPYGLLAVIAAVRSRDSAEALANLSVTLLIASGGLMFLADVIFFCPDAQGAIALLMAPILQGIGIMILVPLAHWVFRLIIKYRSTPNEH
jgi:hypothetical protein